MLWGCPAPADFSTPKAVPCPAVARVPVLPSVITLICGSAAGCCALQVTQQPSSSSHSTRARKIAFADSICRQHLQVLPACGQGGRTATAAAEAAAAAGPAVSHGLLLQSLWRIPSVAVS